MGFVSDLTIVIDDIIIIYYKNRSPVMCIEARPLSFMVTQDDSPVKCRYGINVKPTNHKINKLQKNMDNVIIAACWVIALYCDYRNHLSRTIKLV